MSEFREAFFRPENRCWLDGSVRYASGARAAAGVGALLLLAGSLLAACDRQDTPQLSPERKAAVKDTIRTLTAQVVASYDSLEPAPYLARFSDDFQYFGEGRRWSRAKFEQMTRKEMATFQRSSFEMVDPTVEVLGQGAAAISLGYHGEYVDSAGQTHGGTSLMTLVYEKRDGEWLIVRAHQSVPPENSGGE